MQFHASPPAETHFCFFVTCCVATKVHMASRGGTAADSEIRGKWVPLAIKVVSSSASQVFVSIAALNWSFAGRRAISRKAHAQVPDRARHRNDLGRPPGDSVCNLHAFQRQYHAYLAFLQVPPTSFRLSLVRSAPTVMTSPLCSTRLRTQRHVPSHPGREISFCFASVALYCRSSSALILG